MKNVTKYCILLGIFLIFLTPSNAATDFCLEKDGFIYPLISKNDCENSTDEKLKLEEYRFIRDFDNKDRRQKLLTYREDLLKKKQEVNTEQEEVAEKPKISQEEKIDIQKEAVKRYRAEKNEKLKQLMEKRKKELAAKRAKQKELVEQRKKKRELLNAEKKRIAQERKKKLLTEQAEKRKIAEEKRKVLLARKTEKKRIAEEKRKQLLAEKEEQKRLSQEERLAELELEKQLKEVAENKNNELKIVYLDKKIIKNEILPTINSDSTLDFTKSDSLDKDAIKTLFANNSNLTLIIPKDIDAFSIVVSENEITSKLVAGTRSIPNPEFNRLEMDIRKAERELRKSEAKMEEGSSRAQCISCGLFFQLGGLAMESRWQKVANELQSNLVNLNNSYSSIPQFLEKEILQNYKYVVQNVKTEKNALYQIIQSKDNKYIEKNISLNSDKNFKVAHNIDPQDKNYESLLNKYSNSDQITRWQNQKIKNISINEIMSDIENETSFKELLSKKELYASLNFEYEEENTFSFSSWFAELFNFSKPDKNKTASLNNKSSSDFEIKDNRFDSVVIVKTESGLGSGFFVSNDEILTNYHVIENALSISITDINNKRSSAVVIKKDLKRDLALLKTNITGKSVEFYDGQLKQGEIVVALGHPEGRKFSLTKGTISAIRKENSGYSATREKNVLFIQTDAAINHGNSGGPLFYEDKVVGVNTQGLNKTEGMNFAVHFSEVQKFLSSN